MTNKVKCKDDCPKGGICPRTVIGTYWGKLRVENHFECAAVQKFILDNANRIKIKRN